jgi:hypothetical protein
LSCKYTGIGPTGGFCLDNKTRDVGGNGCVSIHFAKALALMMGPVMTIDLGCGLGQYGPVLRQNGVKWVGYDGAENIEEVTKGHVKFLDLSEPLPSSMEKGDWSMSIEVGEHIPVQNEVIFVYNVLSMCKNSTVLSWALPGQMGHHHVNLRSNQYVKSKFECVGFTFQNKDTTMLRNTVDNSCPWLRKTVMVFQKTHQTWNSFEYFRTLYTNCSMKFT